jgi:hypothetical protein
MANFVTSARRTLFMFSISAICLAPAHAHGQTRWYLSVLGTDTLSLERFERAGNTITGLWVTYHTGADRHRAILRHEYMITLAADDRPLSVHLLLRRPDSAVRRTYDARFDDDSVVITVTPDTLPPHNIVAHRAFPVLGAAMSMYQLLIGGARTGKQAPDSAAIVVVPLTGPFVAQKSSVTLPSANTFRFGGPGSATIFTGPHGAIDSLVTPNGNVPMRQVGAFDIDAIALAASKGTQTGR